MSSERSPLIVWFGELTTRRRLLTRGSVLVWPGTLWLLTFLVLPLLGLMFVAFLKPTPYGELTLNFTWDNFRSALGDSTVYGWQADNLWTLLRSLWVAAVTTTLCILLAYPLAFWIAARAPRWRYVMLALVIIPLCTNLVVRITAWQLVLTQDLPPARLASAVTGPTVSALSAVPGTTDRVDQWLAGFVVAPGEALYPGPLAVYLAMVSTFLPFAVLPIYTNAERLDWSIVEAAHDLYASRWRIFWHALLPQTMPGLTVALILTFIPAMGMFLIPQRLSGGNYMLIGNLIQLNVYEGKNIPAGAALSLCLMLITLAGLWLYWRKARGQELAS